MGVPKSESLNTISKPATLKLFPGYIVKDLYRLCIISKLSRRCHRDCSRCPVQTAPASSHLRSSGFLSGASRVASQERSLQSPALNGNCCPSCNFWKSLQVFPRYESIYRSDLRDPQVDPGSGEPRSWRQCARGKQGSRRNSNFDPAKKKTFAQSPTASTRIFGNLARCEGNQAEKIPRLRSTKPVPSPAAGARHWMPGERRVGEFATIRCPRPPWENAGHSA